MKTPKQVLLESTRNHKSDLDRIRIEAIRLGLAKDFPSSKKDFTAVFILEWIRPFRWYWSTLTAGWALIVVLNMATGIDPQFSSELASTEIPKWSPELEAYTAQALMTRMTQEDPYLEVAVLREEEAGIDKKTKDDHPLTDPPGPQSELRGDQHSSLGRFLAA